MDKGPLRKRWSHKQVGQGTTEEVVVTSRLEKGPVRKRWSQAGWTRDQ